MLGFMGRCIDYPSEGGLLERDLERCLEVVGRRTRPRALTVCQFDPDVGDGDCIARIAIRATVAFMRVLVERGVLQSPWY